MFTYQIINKRGFVLGVITAMSRRDAIEQALNIWSARQLNAVLIAG